LVERVDWPLGAAQEGDFVEARTEVERLGGTSRSPTAR
jgi:hypothetical protein